MSSENNVPQPTGVPLGEISQAQPPLEAFLDKHQMKLIATAAVLALFAICYVVYDGLKTSGEQSAGSELVAAEDIMAYQSIVSNHEGTAAAYSAKILLAEEQWIDGQEDDSIETLRNFIDSENSHPARPSAQASLAAKLKAQGELEEAEGVFRDLTDDPAAGYLAAYAWISLGDLELAKGNTEKAMTAYEEVERNFPGSSYIREATNRQLLAKATSPKVVSAPISVPDVKFTDDEEGTGPTSGVDLENQDLLNALKGGLEGGTEDSTGSEESNPPE
ncbi:MAG: tol-pal system YbgF family protein [Akkermansiaceae bacterium]